MVSITSSVVSILTGTAGRAAGYVASACAGALVDGRCDVAVTNCPGFPKLTDDAVFPIGSLTKLVTGSLLTELERRGTVSGGASVTDILGSEGLPAYWRDITLSALAAHDTALPRVPFNLRGPLWDPYRGWDDDRLRDAMERTRLDAGAAHEYSNFGYAVLTACLCRATGSSYETLIRHELATPLAASTLTTAPEADAVPPGFDGDKPADVWSFEAMVGAGGAYASIRDVLRVAASAMPVESDGTARNRGWRFLELPSGRRVPWISGELPGYSSAVAVQPRNGLVVAVLTNSGTPQGLTKVILQTLAELSHQLRSSAAAS